MMRNFQGVKKSWKLPLQARRHPRLLRSVAGPKGDSSRDVSPPLLEALLEDPNVAGPPPG